MKIILVFLCMICCTQIPAQQDTAKKGISITAYAEVFYSYDLNTPVDNNRPGFLYSHNRHNEFNVNLGFLKASYATEKSRANLAFATGTYINANYAAEPGVLKNIYEANAGIKLSNKKNLWLDAGILPSHIGFESALSKDCWTVTRSLLAENSPYYEAGVKLTYTSDNGKWLLSAMALNGWQRIRRLDGNSLMSWGTQVQFKPSGNVLLNYSTFIGTDKPDTARQLRIFHNLYSMITINDKLGLTLGADIGTEEKSQISSKLNVWYSPIAIIRYTPHKNWAIAARAEYYSDPDGVIINTPANNGFKTAGYSINIDHAPVNNILVRLEARSLVSTQPIFQKDDRVVKHNNFITSSIAISF